MPKVMALVMINAHGGQIKARTTFSHHVHYFDFDSGRDRILPFIITYLFDDVVALTEANYVTMRYNRQFKAVQCNDLLLFHHHSITLMFKQSKKILD